MERLNRRLKLCAVIAAVLMLFSLIVAALNIIFNRTGWLYKEYLDDLDIERTSGISADDAERVLSRMMYYAIGRADDLDITITENGEQVEFFNERELSHMVDVRRLAMTVMWSGMISLILSAGFVLYLLIARRTECLRAFAKAFLITLAVVAVIAAALGIWAGTDFNSFWQAFHVVFLDLESSTFDPASSRMIRICPAKLFSDFVGILAFDAVLTVGAAAVICAVLLVVLRKKHGKQLL
ncbi:MAG: DUF1461 domain-containing protein [Clostridia bacterium]|nr:DUF1461 domain-containing protein [Clostridia bacterium]